MLQASATQPKVVSPLIIVELSGSRSSRRVGEATNLLPHAQPPAACTEETNQLHTFLCMGVDKGGVNAIRVLSLGIGNILHMSEDCSPELCLLDVSFSDLVLSVDLPS